MKIKALSLWQPWALLCVVGAKQFETRSWQTDYRGPLLIHAARRWTKDEEAIVRRDLFWSAWADAPHHLMARGCLLGIVDLVGVYPTDEVIRQLEERELSFGNYGSGRFAWKLENPRWFEQSIPTRGRQGLWTVDIEPALIEQARRNK